MKKPSLTDLIALCVAAQIVLGVAGCVSGNRVEAEANLIKVEKQSTAKEVDQYVTTAGRVVRFFGFGADAEQEKK